MGTMSAWWSEQVWNDLNCRLNIYHDLIHNNTGERWYDKYWYVNGVVAFTNTYQQWENVPLPNTLSWRYPAGTTMLFAVKLWRWSTELDRATWGTGTFPEPPGAPQPAAPAIAISDAGRNAWDILVYGSGATNHEVFVADANAGEPYYGGGGSDSGWRRYYMPAPHRTATIRGRAYNVNARGYAGPVSDSFLTLNSENVVPNAPGNVAFAAARKRMNDTIRLSWTHSDPELDVQKHQEVEVRRNGGAWSSLGVLTNSSGYRDLTFGLPGYWEARVRTTDFENNYGAWSPVAGVTIYSTQIRTGGAWVDAPDSDYVRSGNLWVPMRKTKLL